MCDFINVAKVSEIPPGTSKAITVGEKTIAIFHRPDEKWLAIDDYCPHMGASLADGPVVDDVVECPWHGWQFRLSDGKWVNNPKLSIGCYNVRIENDEVLVNLNQPMKQ
jgi:nitrite reductase (NADH) small subunit/3-phenylpropionate/trans-cinnamate dioxygenase ferredoxin subunit